VSKNELRGLCTHQRVLFCFRFLVVSHNDGGLYVPRFAQLSFSESFPVTTPSGLEETAAHHKQTYLAEGGPTRRSELSELTEDDQDGNASADI